METDFKLKSKGTGKGEGRTFHPLRRKYDWIFNRSVGMRAETGPAELVETELDKG